MDERLVRVLRELVDAGGASLLDPNPISFRREHGRRVRSLRKLLQNATLEAQDLPTEQTRNEFLYGCLAFTGDASIEHLIVAQGWKSGATTYVGSIMHAQGERGRVAVPPSFVEAAREHLASAPDAEILTFHNHPFNVINATIDNRPLASSADRELLLQTRYLQPLVALRTLFGLGGVRHYLGENGEVREYTTPGLLRLASLIPAEWVR